MKILFILLVMLLVLYAPVELSRVSLLYSQNYPEIYTSQHLAWEMIIMWGLWFMAVPLLFYIFTRVAGR